VTGDGSARRGWVGWGNHMRKIKGSDYQDVGNSNSINGGGRLLLKAREKEPLLPCSRSRLANFFSASVAHNTPLCIEGANPNPNDPTNGLKAHKANKIIAATVPHVNSALPPDGPKGP
jgi:hypothetical protein